MSAILTHKKALLFIISFCLVLGLSISAQAAHTPTFSLQPTLSTTLANLFINFSISNDVASPDNITTFNLTALNTTELNFSSLNTSATDANCTKIDDLLISCALLSDLLNGTSTWVYMAMSANGQGNFSFNLTSFDTASAVVGTTGYFFIDSQPTASPTNLQVAGKTFTTIDWTWDNPVDSDFNETIVNIYNSQGTLIASRNTSNAFFNATTLTINSNYTINLTTRDVYGNTNTTVISNTTSTNADTTNPAYDIYNASNLNPSSGSTITLFSHWTDDTMSIGSINASLYVDGTLNQTTLNTTDGYTNFSYSIPLNKTGAINFTIQGRDIGSNTNTTPDIIITVSDTTLPSISLSNPANNSATNVTTVSFQFTATDNAAGNLDCSLILNGVANATNTSVTQSTTTTFLVANFADASYNWSINCTDAGANTNSSPTRNLTYNARPPASVTSLASQSKTYSTIDWSWINPVDSDFNESHVLVYNSIGTLVAFANTSNAYFNGTGLTINSNYTINITTRDHYGNINITVVSNTTSTSADTTLPTSTLNITLNNSWITDNTPEIGFNLTDTYDSALNYTIFLDGISNLTGTSTNDTWKYINLSALSDSTHSILVEARDTANNRMNSSTLVLNIDTSAPFSNINLTANGTATTDPTPDISFNLTDNLASTLNYTIFIDGVANATGTATNSTWTYVTLSTLTSGIHTILVEATDNAVQRTNSSSLTLTIDMTLPGISLSSPANNSATNATTATFQFNVSDNIAGTLSCSLILNGILNTTNASTTQNAQTSFLITGLPDGSYNWSVNCTDIAGNTNSSPTRNLTYNARPPGSVTGLGMLSKTYTSITWNWANPADNDFNESIVLVYSSTGALVSNSNTSSTSFTASSLAINANYTINITTRDIYGNINATVVSNTTATDPDTTLPTSTLNITLNNTWTRNNTPQIGFNLTDNYDSSLNYTVFVDGSSNLTGTSSNNTWKYINLSALSDGTHSLLVESRDTANNRMNSSTLVLHIDTTPPSANINLSLNASTITSTTPTLSFNLTDALASTLNYTLFVDGVANSTGNASNNTQTYVALSPLSNGPHSIIVEGADQVTLRANSSTLNFTVDSSAPISTLNITLNNSWTNDNTPEIGFNLTDNLASTINYTLFVDSVASTTGTATNNTWKYVNLSALNNGTHTILVEATDNAVQRTNSSILTLRIDTALPTSSLNSSLNNSWITDNTPEIGFNLTDNLASTINYTIFIDATSNATGTATNNTWTYINLSSLSDGSHTIKVEAKDSASNRINSTALTIYIDTIAPSAFMNSSLNNTWINANPVAVTFNLTDNLAPLINYTLYVDSTANTTGTTSTLWQTVNITFADGNYSLKVEATDLAGQKTNSSAISILVDTTLPTSTISNPSNDTWTVDETPSITFTVTDNYDNLIDYIIFIDGVANSSSSAPTGIPISPTLPYLRNGTHQIVVEATDNAGNQKNSTPLFITIDTVAPAVHLVMTLNGTSINDPTPLISFNITDNLATTLNYTIFVDSVVNSSNTTGNNTQVSLNLSTLSDGAHQVIVEGTDRVGNRTNSSTLYLTIDSSFPTSELNLTLDNVWTTDNTPTISFNLTDSADTNLSFILFLDNVANSTGTVINNTWNYINLSTINDGTHTIIIEANDSTNNRLNSSALHLIIDTHAPSTIITNFNTLNNTWINTNAPQLFINLTDNLDTDLNYTLYLDGSVNLTGNSTNGTSLGVSLSGLSNGQHTVVIEAADNALQKTNSSTLTLKIDTSLPVVTLDLSANNTWSTLASPSITFNITDTIDSMLNYTVFVDGASNTNGNVSNNTQITISLSPLSNGTHIILVEGLDDASNRANSSTLILHVDTSIPAISLNLSLNNTWINDSTPEITFNGTDNLADPFAYILFVDSSAVSNGTINNNTLTHLNLSALADGIHTIIIEAQDLANNVRNSTPLTLNIDSTLPTVSALLSPANGATLNNTNITFNFTSYDNLDANLSYTFILNEVANATGYTNSNNSNTSFTANLSYAYYNWTIKVQDHAGNAFTFTPVHTFNLSDSTPPNSYPTWTALDVHDNDHDGNIELNWSADINPDTVYYRIYRSNTTITNASNLTRIAQVTGNSFEDNTTANGTTYWYALTSTDSSFNENKSLVSASYNGTANDTIAPSVTTNLNVTTNADGSIQLVWTEVSLDIANNTDLNNTYLIFRSTNLSTINTSNSSSAIANTTNFAYNDTGITTGTMYYYIVTTLDDGDNYNSSNLTQNTNNITAAACTSTWEDATGWGTCSSGIQSKTQTRICYGGGSTSQQVEQSCSGGLGNGGGGGGGGGIIIPPVNATNATIETNTTNQTQSNFTTNITLPLPAGTKTPLTISNPNIAVYLIELLVDQTVSQVSLQVQKMAEGNVPTLVSGKVFQYLQITAQSLQNLKTAEISFKIPKSWLEDQNIPKEGIALYRFKDTWIPLETMILSDDGTTISFKATTPGFSYFAIAQKIENKTQNTNQTLPEEPVITPPQLNTTSGNETSVSEKMTLLSWVEKIFSFLIIIAVVAFVLAYLILYKRKKGPKNKEEDLDKLFSDKDFLNRTYPQEKKEEEQKGFLHRLKHTFKREHHEKKEHRDGEDEDFTSMVKKYYEK